MMRVVAIVVCFLLLVDSLAWEQCPMDGVCPTSNTCCQGSDGTTTCITAQVGSSETAVCCRDGGDEDNPRGMISTGCGPGYLCVSTSNRSFCQLNSTSTSKPTVLPRYQLCQAPNDGVTQLHALPIRSNLPKLAYYSNMGSILDMGKSRAQTIDQVLIIIHGSGRNADDYLCCGMSSVANYQQQTNSTILVVAPYFLAPGDIDNDDMLLTWNETGPGIPHSWRYGANSLVGNVSSYEAMDAMVETIIRQSPNVQRIMVPGHSAGGQFTHRWALLSTRKSIWEKTCHHGSTTISTSRSKHCPIVIRVVVANPRSFCYLDERRYDNETGMLAVPSSYRISRCPGYNSWEWGLDTRHSRLPAPYVEEVIRRIGVEGLQQQYAQRNVVYLAGSLDVLKVHAECEDDGFQGLNRFQRSQWFYSSLEQVYGRPVHQRLVAKGVPHDHCLMFQSDAGQRALFGPRLKNANNIMAY